MIGSADVSDENGSADQIGSADVFDESCPMRKGVR